MYLLQVNHKSCESNHVLAISTSDHSELIDINGPTEARSSLLHTECAVHVFCFCGGYTQFVATGSGWNRADKDAPYELLAWSYGNDASESELVTVSAKCVGAEVPLLAASFGHVDRKCQLADWRQLERAMAYVDPIASIRCDRADYFDYLTNVGVLHPSGIVADPFVIMSCARELPGQMTKAGVFETVGRYFLEMQADVGQASGINWTRLLQSVISVLVCPFPCPAEEKKTHAAPAASFDFSPLFKDHDHATSGTHTNKLVQALCFLKTLRNDQTLDRANKHRTPVAYRLAKAASMLSACLCEVLSPLDGPYTVLLLKSAHDEETIVLDPSQFIVYPIKGTAFASSSELLKQLPNPFMSCPFECRQLRERLQGPVIRCQDPFDLSTFSWIPVVRETGVVANFWDVVNAPVDDDSIECRVVPIHMNTPDEIRIIQALSCPAQPIRQCSKNPGILKGSYSRHTISTCATVGLDSSFLIESTEVWYDSY